MSAPKVFHCKHLATAPRSQRFQSTTGANHGTTSWPKSKRSFVPHSPGPLCHSQQALAKLLEVLPIPLVRWHEPATRRYDHTAHRWAATPARNTERTKMPCCLSAVKEHFWSVFALNAKVGQVSWGCKILAPKCGDPTTIPVGHREVPTLTPSWLRVSKSHETWLRISNDGMIPPKNKGVEQLSKAKMFIYMILVIVAPSEQKNAVIISILSLFLLKGTLANNYGEVILRIPIAHPFLEAPRGSLHQGLTGYPSQHGSMTSPGPGLCFPTRSTANGLRGGAPPAAGTHMCVSPVVEKWAWQLLGLLCWVPGWWGLWVMCFLRRWLTKKWEKNTGPKWNGWKNGDWV